MDFPKKQSKHTFFLSSEVREARYFFFSVIIFPSSLLPSIFPHWSGFSDLIVLTFLFFFCFVLPLPHLSHLTQLSYGPLQDFVGLCFFLRDVYKVERIPVASLRAVWRVKELTDVSYRLSTNLYISVWCLSFPVKTCIYLH